MANSPVENLLLVLDSEIPKYLCDCDTEIDKETGVEPSGENLNYHGDAIWGEECRYCRIHRSVEDVKKFIKL